MSELVTIPDPELNERLTELQQHLLKLFEALLSQEPMQGMDEKLQRLHQCSFYLELHMDDSVWPLVSQDRLQGALRKAHSHVSLLLTLMDVLLEILLQSEQGQLDPQLLTALATVRMVHEALKDTRTEDCRPTCNLGSLDLGIQLFPDMAPQPLPSVTTMLHYKQPVFIDRFLSRAKSTTVHLAWYFAAGQHDEDPCQLFEVQSKMLRPEGEEPGLCDKYAVMGLSHTLKDLTPDHFYQFSVRRVPHHNLVYSEFTDAIILKTLTARGQNY